MNKRAGWLLISVIGILLAAAIWSNYPLKLIPYLPDIFGFNGSRKYLAVLQNNNELRPTGGFMGSYAIVTVNRGKISFSVNDIYEPDGLVVSHIDPPPPIQEAFQLGTWRLRDANWDPDFPKSVQTIEWFMDKAGLSGFDGVIAVNLAAVEKSFESLGTVSVVDYQETISNDNVWDKAQSYAQENYFPGSKQKKEFLSSLSSAVINKYHDLNIFVKLKLFLNVVGQLNQKQIQVYSRDISVQRVISNLNWAGEIKSPTCPWWTKKCAADSIMIVEANLGVNKANRNVTRTANLEVTSGKDKVNHSLTINFENNISDNKWGGKYKAWVRVIFPGGEKGFWIDVPEGEIVNKLVEYDTPLSSTPNKPYSLLWQKQSGIDNLPITLTITKNDKTKVIRDNLTGDKLMIL